MEPPRQNQHDYTRYADKKSTYYEELQGKGGQVMNAERIAELREWVVMEHVVFPMSIADDLLAVLDEYGKQPIPSIENSDIEDLARFLNDKGLWKNAEEPNLGLWCAVIRGRLELWGIRIVESEGDKP